MAVDEPAAKATILGFNGIGGRMKELEEAWIVQALVREDGLSQLQVAELFSGTRVGCVVGWRFWNGSRRSAVRICGWDCCRRRWRGS